MSQENETARLLAKYVDIANAYGGDDSIRARKFLRDHSDNQEFVRIVRTTRGVRKQLAVGALK
jgi:hypothetical protein